MKNLYNINKWLIIVTLLLYLTLYLGMIFQIVLGTMQVLMSIYILTKYNTLEKKTKSLFIIYLIATVTTLVLIASGLTLNNGLFMIHLIIPMLIAFFHLYITYKIKIS
jgi:hypothetical protein